MAKTKNKLIKTIPCLVPANNGKVQQLNALLAPAQSLLSQLISNLDKEFLTKGQINKYCAYKTNDFNTKLSARYLQTLYAQALESYRSYLAILHDKFLQVVYHANLDDFTLTTLVRINKYQSWLKKELSLNWVKIDGTLVPANKKTKNSFSLPVDKDILNLARHIIKKIKTWISRPNLSNVRTLKLDSKIAQISSSDNHFNYWVKISTLQKGKPVIVPLLNNKYLFKQIERGKLLKFIQLTFNDDKIIKISPIVEQPTVNLRKHGSNLGIDWGMKSLFTTSDGRMFGRQMLSRLKSLDKYLTSYASDLQSQGVALKNDSKYRQLQAKIKHYVKNEIGRVLNQISLEEIQTISVEKLNFAGGGLSRSLNRLITRCGRHALKVKLQRLQEEYGIQINEVNQAYTSQQCEKCNYTSRKNRTSQKQFRCVKCGFKINADVNAARNIRDRRSVLSQLSSIPRTKKAIYQGLLTLYEQNNRGKITSNIGLVN